MGSVPPPWSFPLMPVSGCVHRHQLIVIKFKQGENRLFKQRRRLALKGGQRLVEKPISFRRTLVISRNAAIPEPRSRRPAGNPASILSRGTP